MTANTKDLNLKTLLQLIYKVEKSCEVVQNDYHDNNLIVTETLNKYFENTKELVTYTDALIPLSVFDIDIHCIDVTYEENRFLDMYTVSHKAVGLGINAEITVGGLISTIESYLSNILPFITVSNRIKFCNNYQRVIGTTTDVYVEGLGMIGYLNFTLKSAFLELDDYECTVVGDLT